MPSDVIGFRRSILDIVKEFLRLHFVKIPEKEGAELSFLIIIIPKILQVGRLQNYGTNIDSNKASKRLENQWDIQQPF